MVTTKKKIETYQDILDRMGSCFDTFTFKTNENMREFTEKETEIYRASLKKIYKPIGVNIFDIC